MRILVIEDEEKLAKSITRGLAQTGYAADYLLDGVAGERRIELYHKDYDLIILDLMLPGKTGFEICRNVRAKGVTVPILILTARNAPGDKVQALDGGGDDYLVKPFPFEELLARIRALLRRPQQALASELRVHDIILKPAEREVYRGGKKVGLTLKEFEMLHYLMRHVGEVVSREDMYVHLWDFAANSLSNIIDAHMKNLRKKLGEIEDEGHEQILETVRGVGYRLKG
jgi:DNA-binding response OmpR family regulator